ncbi:hypothetical protein G7067_06730 [Leucobacter insecticola]|uniref:Uncharacterized protein n=1 Tax=Leucobacter insecticola TaxID=2714934 RepID=A0A6G8FFK1_9MICO|nr:hypothetical protein [Leucobacter insecticola]QIM15160.1 hypothetical protein G7067_06730 [Leucobacter insecticola]
MIASAPAIPVDALGSRIHPHHGIFAPVRGEDLELVARAEFPGGAGWIMLADLAERLGPRSRRELLTWIADSTA